jgi:transcriptional regulator with XRE-family HTH domain
MEPQGPVTGLDLKLARIAARVKQKAIGRAMGVSESRVSAIEREAVVTPETADRYVAALDTCRTDAPKAVA